MKPPQYHRPPLRPETLIDLARATYELALARVSMAVSDPDALLSAQKMEQEPAQSLSPAQAKIAGRVEFAIRAMGARVPWKSDCLVQALAARHWLEGAGIRTSLFIGVRQGEAQLDAHAWLSAGGRNVTGGDGREYARIYGTAE